MQYTINDATGVLSDDAGNVGIFEDGNPVYEAYLKWHAADPDANQIRTIFVPDPAPVPRVVSKVDFMNRFTDGELAGIYGAARASVPVEVWLERFRLSESVDLDSARVAAGLAALEKGGLLAAGRVDELLV